MWAAAVAELAGADQSFSTDRPDSVNNRLDCGELDLGQCPAVVAEVLELGRSAAVATVVPSAG